MLYKSIKHKGLYFITPLEQTIEILSKDGELFDWQQNSITIEQFEESDVALSLRDFELESVLNAFLKPILKDRIHFVKHMVPKEENKSDFVEHYVFSTLKGKEVVKIDEVGVYFNDKPMLIRNQMALTIAQTDCEEIKTTYF